MLKKRKKEQIVFSLFYLTEIAAFVVYPILEDYQLAMTIVYGFVVSLFIVIYLFCFWMFIRNRFQLGVWKEIYIISIFLAIHFLLFKSAPESNLYMLTAINLTCLMFYLIPSLLCCSLAFLVMINDDLAEAYQTSTTKKKGIFWLCAYIAIFSNLVNNVLFVCTVGILFLKKVIVSFIKKERFDKRYWLQCFPYWIVFGMEIVCIAFEMNGQRASSLEFNLRIQVVELFSDIRYIWDKMNKEVLFIMFIVIVATILFASLKNNRTEKDKKFVHMMIQCGMCFLLCGVYMCCLMTRIGLHKFRRCGNIFVVFFFFAVMFALALAYTVGELKKASVLMPLLLYITFIQVIQGNGHVYKSSFSLYGGDEIKCKAANESIINQFIEADEKGLTELELDWGEDGLGTLDFTGDRISQTLFNHRIISHKIDVVN